MTRKQSIGLAAVLLMIGLLIGTLVLGGCAAPSPTPTEVVTATPTKVVETTPTKVVAATPTKVVETTPRLAELAEKIRAGEIDVGKEYGMGVGQRYHEIHAKVLGQGCDSCHTGKLTFPEVIFFHQDLSPNAPGAVDRRYCLKCHQEGPATDLY